MKESFAEINVQYSMMQMDSDYSTSCTGCPVSILTKTEKKNQMSKKQTWRVTNKQTDKQ